MTLAPVRTSDKLNRNPSVLPSRAIQAPSIAKLLPMLLFLTEVAVRRCLDTAVISKCAAHFGMGF